MIFKSIPAGNDDALVLGLTECGSKMAITIGYVGFVEYEREQSEELAKRLESAADLIRSVA